MKIGPFNDFRLPNIAYLEISLIFYDFFIIEVEIFVKVTVVIKGHSFFRFRNRKTAAGTQIVWKASIQFAFKSQSDDRPKSQLKMNYPFVKSWSTQISSNQLDLPKWTFCVSEIFKGLSETFEPPQSVLNVKVTTPSYLPYVAVPTLIPDITNGGYRLDFLAIPKEQFLQTLNQSTPHKLANKQGTSHLEFSLLPSATPQLSQAPPALNEIEKRQTTSKIVLQFRTYFSTLVDKLKLFLETIPPNNEQRLLPLKHDNPDCNQIPEQHLEAIRGLKKKLIEIVARIDEELLEYSTRQDSSYTWTDWSELAQQKDHITALLEQFDVGSLRRHLSSVNDGATNQTVLADIIGLRREVGKEILNHLSSHELPEDRICRYFSDVANFTGLGHADSSIEQQLSKLGFTDERAKLIANEIEANGCSLNHITIVEIAQNFVLDLFRYDLLLTDELAVLPDWKQVSNEYFTTSSTSGKERKITCKNFEKTKKTDNLKKFLTSNCPNELLLEATSEFEYWFHGTDNLYASDILALGVNTSMGEKKRFFKWQWLLHVQ